EDSGQELEGAVNGLSRVGAKMVEVGMPAGFNQGARDWLPLCAVECAIAHEATYPSRANDYGPVLAALIESGRKLSAMDMAHLQLRRAALTGELDKLLASFDLLLMPVMGRAAWTLDALAQAGRDVDAVAA